jgi:hypothetical protein
MYTKFCSDRTTKNFCIPIHHAGIEEFHNMTPASDEELEATCSRFPLESSSSSAHCSGLRALDPTPSSIRLLW